jgi:hypothetical protein
MNRTALEAANRVAELLARENAALQRMDLSAAVALVPAKETALADLARETPLPSSALSPAVLALGRRLADLAEENRILLERAIGVQVRIVQMIARAGQPIQETVHYRHPADRRNPYRSLSVAMSRRV